MTKAVLFSSFPGDIPAEMAFKNNLEATAAPTVNDDSADGYFVGSTWFYAGIGYVCTSAVAGAAVWAIMSAGGTTPGQITAPAAATPTGTGGAASLTGGTGGATSGDGGDVAITGGAASAGNGNGGSLVLTGGAKNGTGIAGAIITRGLAVGKQGAPTAKTVSATLTAAELLTGIITVNQGAGATSTLTLPSGTDMQAALSPDFGTDDFFEFTVINTSTVDAEDAALASPGASFTIVGSLDIPAHSGITVVSSGTFRVRETAANTFVAYRK